MDGVKCKYGQITVSRQTAQDEVSEDVGPGRCVRFRGQRGQERSIDICRVQFVPDDVRQRRGGT